MSRGSLIILCGLAIIPLGVVIGYVFPDFASGDISMGFVFSGIGMLIAFVGVFVYASESPAKL